MILLAIGIALIVYGAGGWLASWLGDVSSVLESMNE